jgi:hypothetical protein
MPAALLERRTVSETVRSPGPASKKDPVSRAVEEIVADIERLGVAPYSAQNVGEAVRLFWTDDPDREELARTLLREAGFEQVDALIERIKEGLLAASSSGSSARAA